MAKNPAFNFYSDNFLSGTMFFTNEQTGKYIRLLCAQHQTGHLEEKHMIFICGTHDEDIWKKFTKDDNGLYFNERLDFEINKRNSYSESRSNNKKGKKLKPKIISKSYDDHMGIGKGIGKGLILSSSLNIEFETFWNEYDKKVGDKSKLEKKWISLTNEERELIMEHIPLYKLSQPDKKFRKDPSTFLNNKSWNDEIIISNGGKQKQLTVSERSGELDGIVSAVFRSKGM